ncbi:MAG: TerB family tellurite resistance protein [Bacteroidales bacterium]|nr:TerB family tellurite resistance protein [Bacteroidales bacterium]
MGFAKWIAGSLGWAAFGPIGGLLGFAIGSFIDSASNAQVNVNTGNQFMGTTERSTAQDFHVSLLVLVAAVMKADGVVVKSELNYVKQFLLQQHGETRAKAYLQVLKDLLEKNIPIADVCMQIRSNTTYATRLQLLHLLFGVAMADNQVHSNELRVIEQISNLLQVTNNDFNSVKAMFVKDTKSAYTILGITPDATNDEVKKSYREMAKKHHPDLVSTLGEDVQRKAKEKFQEIQDAYEQIKKERGL